MAVTDFLRPTAFIDSADERIKTFANAATAAARDDKARAIALYGAVRDGVTYDPYLDYSDENVFRASAVLAEGRGFCVGKSALLAACARANGMPARVGFADVRNHLTVHAARRAYEPMCIAGEPFGRYARPPGSTRRGTPGRRRGRRRLMPAYRGGSSGCGTWSASWRSIARSPLGLVLRGSEGWVLLELDRHVRAAVAVADRPVGRHGTPGAGGTGAVQVTAGGPRLVPRLERRGLRALTDPAGHARPRPVSPGADVRAVDGYVAVQHVLRVAPELPVDDADRVPGIRAVQGLLLAGRDPHIPSTDSGDSRQLARCRIGRRVRPRTTV